MTEKELQALCAEWQQVLRLQDWDVVVKTMRTVKMEFRDVSGECHYERSARRALIHIVDPVDYHHEVWPQDMERTLVHELLHLHFSLFAAEDATPQDIAQEQAIESIAHGLIELKRRGKRG